MNLDHDFFQVSKLSEDQKKTSLPKMEHFFSPNSSGGLRSDAHQSQIILEGMQMKTILKFLGGYSQTIGGDISRHPSRVLGPLHVRLPKETSTSSKSLFANKRTTLYYTVGKNRFCA